MINKMLILKISIKVTRMKNYNIMTSIWNYLSLSFFQKKINILVCPQHRVQKTVSLSLTQ